MALLFLAAMAVLLTTCGVSSGTVSLSGEPGYKIGPAVWMLGDFDIRLSMEHAEEDACSDWRIGLAYEVFDTWHYVFAKGDADYRDGDDVGTVEGLGHKLHIDADIPAACGTWSATFTPASS